MDIISHIKPGERVIFTAWGCEEPAARVLTAGGFPVFCDIDLTCGDADLKHLSELCKNGARAFVTHIEGAAADLARSFGIEAVVLPAGSAVQLPQLEGLESLGWRGFEDIMRFKPGYDRGELLEKLSRTGTRWELPKPVYDGDAFRFAHPAPEQYPYYMLYLDGAESLCRECVRIIKI